MNFFVLARAKVEYYAIFLKHCLINQIASCTYMQVYFHISLLISIFLKKIVFPGKLHIKWILPIEFFPAVILFKILLINLFLLK